MAQYTVSLSPALRQPGGTCTFLVRDSKGDYVEFTVRDGETIRTDDPSVAAALNSYLTGPGGERMVAALAVRPPNPTHDVDTKPRKPRAVRER